MSSMDDIQQNVPAPLPTPVPTDPMPAPAETEPINSIDRANAAIDRMKEENDRTEALLERQESLRASDILGGKSDAGQAPVPPKEETAEEYAAKVMGGDVE